MDIERLETATRMSRAVMHGDTIYLCGQVAKDRQADIAGQTATTLEKIEELLERAGSDKKRLLSVTIYLADIKDFKAMNDVWDAWVEPGFAPARACVEARMASPELLVEMSVIAARN